MLADGTLDVYIADLLETKLRLISAVETDEPLDGPMLEDRLRALGPALLQQNRVASGSAAVLERLEKLAVATPRAPESPLLSGGVQQFRSSRVVRDLRNVGLDGLPQAPHRAKYDAKKDIAMHESSDGTYHGESG